jgi:hypothetical protein
MWLLPCANGSSAWPALEVIAPLLRFVQLDSEWRLDRAAADGWFRWGAAFSICAPAHVGSSTIGSASSGSRNSFWQITKRPSRRQDAPAGGSG